MFRCTLLIIRNPLTIFNYLAFYHIGITTNKTKLSPIPVDCKDSLFHFHLSPVMKIHPVSSAQLSGKLNDITT